MAGVAPPASLAAWAQGHWSIENQLHRVRDVTWDEDRSQIGSAPQVDRGDLRYRLTMGTMTVDQVILEAIARPRRARPS